MLMWQTIRRFATLLAGVGIFVSLHGCTPEQENGQEKRKEEIVADTLSSDATKNEQRQLKRWIGERPVSEEGSFLELPDVKPILRKTVSTDIYERLTNLQQKPYYLTMPIDYIDGYYFLRYPSNNHYNRRGDRVMIALRPNDHEMHVAIMNNGEVEWRHTGDDSVPEFLYSRIR